MSSVPFRKSSQQGRKASLQGRKSSLDPRNEVRPYVEHYIGIDVGTGSARACIMNDQGDIVGLASENIGLWQPQTGYYVRLAIYVVEYSSDNHRNNPLPTSGTASARQCDVR